MKKHQALSVTAMTIVLGVCGLSTRAHAYNDASALSTLSALPIASVVVGGSAIAGSVVAIPVALSSAGAVLVVKAVESTARGTILILERASDGARASVEVIGKGVAAASVAVGTTLTVTLIGAGVILLTAGEAVAFIASSIGRALLHDEQLTY